MYGLRPAAKAWVALVLGCVIAGLYVLDPALSDGALSVQELCQVLAAALGPAVAVWSVPNTNPI